MSRHQLDARRLLCPMPVIRVQDLIATLKKDDEVEVFATDPGAVTDISAWCRINGHRVLESSIDDGEVRMLLAVGVQ